MKKIQQAIVIDKAEAKLLKKILSAVVYNGNHIQPKAYVPEDRGEYCIACDLLNKATDAYTDTKEYQSEYWARVITEDKKTHGRALKHGKRIIVNGREFFTESDTRVDDHYIFVTDGRTGLGCGNLSFLKKNWEKYDEMASKFGNVADLPLCEYDTVKRVMKIKEEEEK